VNSPLDVKENYEHAHDFVLHLSRLFDLGEFVLSVYDSCFVPRTLV
jgi:hypothetical protein